jgi:hypothetical protein
MSMFRWRGAVGIGLVATSCLGATTARARESVVEMPPARIDFRGHAASYDARVLARWAFEARDTQARPFAVVDKKEARLFVFDADGRLAGAAPVLLGLAKGDESAPDIARRKPGGLAPWELTTPAGRFDSVPGHNDKGEAIVWVDYVAAVAIHRLRPAQASERRAQRLASATPQDNRISLGCIVVAPSFFDDVVAPTLGRQRGTVYVLPETRDWRVVFAAAAGTEL